MFTAIISLEIGHKNRVLLVSRKKNMKSYRIVIDVENALRTVDFAIYFGSRKHKRVGVCHEHWCSIFLRALHLLNGNCFSFFEITQKTGTCWFILHIHDSDIHFNEKS